MAKFIRLLSELGPWGLILATAITPWGIDIRKVCSLEEEGTSTWRLEGGCWEPRAPIGPHKEQDVDQGVHMWRKNAEAKLCSLVTKHSALYIIHLQ